MTPPLSLSLSLSLSLFPLLFSSTQRRGTRTPARTLSLSLSLVHVLRPPVLVVAQVSRGMRSFPTMFATIRDVSHVG